MYSFSQIKTSEFDNFITKFPEEKTFLQGSLYGQFREKMNEKSFQYGFFKEKKLVGVCQFQKINARRGTYLHTPHGPLILSEFLFEVFPLWLKEYHSIGKQEKCDFVRISPLLLEKQTSIFKDTNYRPAPVHLVNPELSWILDITQDEKTLLKNMKKSTRYEINRIERSEIEIKQGNSEKDLNIFWDLHLKTVARHGFVPFSKNSTELELNIYKKNAQIFSAFLKESPDKYYSSSIILFDDRAGYYHQGASEQHKLPFSYATLWSAILEAKKRGCTEFNFWGVSEETNRKHPWFGLSKFKRGFGGEERQYIHAHDAPITYKYWINFVIEQYRKWKKGY